MSVPSPYATELAGLPVAESSVEVLGSTTRYWTYGPDDAAETIVVVHGYRGEHHGLEPVVAHLRGIRVVAPDLPGFGLSEPLLGRAHDIAGYASWLGAFIRELSLESATVLGHSFGTIVVAHAVAGGEIAPPRLIFVNPIAAPASTGPNAALTRLVVFGYKLSAKLPDRVGRWLVGNRGVVRGMSLVMTTTKRPELRRWIHDQHDAYFSDFATTNSVVEGFEASVSHNVIEVAERIRVPTLLIGAERDQITPVEDVRALQRAIPGSQLHIIDGVGHLIHYEKPREAAGYIVDFLGVGSVAD